MKNIYWLIALAILAFLAGCVSNTEKLHLGMSRAEVITAMGNPGSVSGSVGYEILNYTVPDSQGTFTLNRQYLVRLLDGKVESFGFQTQLPPMRGRGVSSNNTAALRIGMTKVEAIAAM